MDVGDEGEVGEGDFDRVAAVGAVELELQDVGVRFVGRELQQRHGGRGGGEGEGGREPFQGKAVEDDGF